MRGPSGSAVTNGRVRRRRRSSFEKPPSGPISTASGDGGRLARIAERVGAPVGLVAEDDAPGRFVALPCVEERAERHRFVDDRQGQDAALLRRLDRVRLQPLAVDARDLAVLRQHRRHPGDAHFGRLLDHVVEARLLERGEEVAEVRRRRLRPDLVADVERVVAPPGGGKRRPELAVAPVEDEDRVAVLEPEHVDEIVRLAAVEVDPRTGREHAADEQALQLRFVCHARR